MSFWSFVHYFVNILWWYHEHIEFFFAYFYYDYYYYYYYYYAHPFNKKPQFIQCIHLFLDEHMNFLQTWIQFQSECGKSDANIKNHKE